MYMFDILAECRSFAGLIKWVSEKIDRYRRGLRAKKPGRSDPVDVGVPNALWAATRDLQCLITVDSHSFTRGKSIIN